MHFINSGRLDRRTPKIHSLRMSSR